MMPKVDGIKVLKTIRDFEKQYGIVTNDQVKIFMTTALTDMQLVRTAFEYGSHAYITKPVDTQKLKEVMDKLGFIDSLIINGKNE